MATLTLRQLNRATLARRVRATVLVDGRVAAFWKVEKKASVVVEPLVKLKKADRDQIDAEREALEEFLAP